MMQSESSGLQISDCWRQRPPYRLIYLSGLKLRQLPASDDSSTIRFG